MLFLKAYYENTFSERKNVISFISVSDSGDEENLPNVLDLENLAGGLCKILPR